MLFYYRQEKLLYLFFYFFHNGIFVYKNFLCDKRYKLKFTTLNKLWVTVSLIIHQSLIERLSKLYISKHIQQYLGTSSKAIGVIWLKLYTVKQQSIYTSYMHYGLQIDEVITSQSLLIYIILFWSFKS